MNISKVYARKTCEGQTVLSENFEDLSHEEVKQIVVCCKKFELLLDKLDEVIYYGRKNPTTSPQCILDLIEDLSNH